MSPRLALTPDFVYVAIRIGVLCSASSACARLLTERIADMLQNVQPCSGRYSGLGNVSDGVSLSYVVARSTMHCHVT